jgi:pantoate kinase
MTTEGVPVPAQTTGLPDNFWSMNLSDTIVSTELQFLHAEIIARLKLEAPDADVLEQMLMERVAFLYVFIRAKETKNLFAHDRSYKETMQLWAGMAADLRKQRQTADALEVIKAQVVAEVAGAVDSALQTFDPAVRKQLRAGMSKALASKRG